MSLVVLFVLLWGRWMSVGLFNPDKEHRGVDYLAPTVVFIVLRMLFLYGADGLVRSVYSAR